MCLPLVFVSSRQYPLVFVSIREYPLVFVSVCWYLLVNLYTIYRVLIPINKVLIPINRILAPILVPILVLDDDDDTHPGYPIPPSHRTQEKNTS